MAIFLKHDDFVTKYQSKTKELLKIILDIKNVYITFNNRKVLTEINSHCETEEEVITEINSNSEISDNGHSQE